MCFLNFISSWVSKTWVHIKFFSILPLFNHFSITLHFINFFFRFLFHSFNVHIKFQQAHFWLIYKDLFLIFILDELYDVNIMNVFHVHIFLSFFLEILHIAWDLSLRTCYNSYSFMVLKYLILNWIKISSFFYLMDNRDVHVY